MKRTQVLDRPETRDKIQPCWRLIVYNCDCHGILDVINLLQQCGLDHFMAEFTALEAHEKGRAIVYEGEKLEAEKRYHILDQGGLEAEVTS